MQPFGGRAVSKPLPAGRDGRIESSLPLLDCRQQFPSGRMARRQGRDSSCATARITEFSDAQQQIAEALPTRDEIRRPLDGLTQQCLGFRSAALSPQEVARKRAAIFKHESQKDRALFPGSDLREFWQRAEARNAETAQRYDALGLAEYAAIEGFVRWDGQSGMEL